ncbi:unnamed protein product [Tilletia controversa]|nr:unnamed protein product [Tilletia controversa]CAD6968033.1 unnamed protein product [Tilletia controversa]
MNPISIFPPPTRALSRQNTKSTTNSSSNNNSSPLARFHTHTADDSSTAAGSSSGGLLHGRNKSLGTSSGGLGSSWSPFSSSTDQQASSSTSPEGAGSNSTSGPRKLIKKKLAGSAAQSNTAASSASLSNSNSSISPVAASAQSGSPAAYITENVLRSNNSVAHKSSHHTLSPSSAPAAKRKPTPDIPADLPQTIFFDRLRPTEVTAAHRLEIQGYPEEDAASLDKLRYRQAAAPHLFMGAFLPGAPKSGKHDHARDPSSSGNNNSGNAGSGGTGAGGGGAAAGGGTGTSNSQPPRTLIGFITATAALALTLKSMSTHSNSRDARLVCIHSVVVAREYQRHGLALRMLREYIGRLMRAELGPRGARLAAMAEAKANAEALAASNPASSTPEDERPTAPVAFADDDLLGEEDDEAELENERSGDRQSRKRGYEALALLAHEEIMPLYLRAGFRVQGLSHINYGSGDWYEMRREIVPKSALRKDDGGADEEDEDDEEDETVQQPTLEEPPSNLSREASGNSADATATPKGGAGTLDTADGRSPAAGGQHSQGASGSSDDGGAGAGPGGINASPPTLNLPKSIDAAALLAALSGSKAAASGSAVGGGVSSPPQAPRNPGVPFSTVLGQALAGKTASEDPRATLEARLVNREESTNLADLYCPRDACDCLLLRADLGVWKARELGPLSAPALRSSNGVLPANAPAPPLNGVAPPPMMRPSAEEHTSPLLFAQQQQQQQQQKQQQKEQPKITMQGASSLRDFWSVPSPFVFDNISFSKDVAWPPKSSVSTAAPTPTTATATAKGRLPMLNRARSNSGSLLSSPPGPAAQEQQASSMLTSPGSRERSNSASAAMVLSDHSSRSDGGGTAEQEDTSGAEEKQRAMFAQGVEAHPNHGGGGAGTSDLPSSVVASTPPLAPPGSKGVKMGGLKLTIGKRKTSLAVPTLNSALGSGSGVGEDGEVSSAGPGTGTGTGLLSPAAITPSAGTSSPGGSSWAASVATSGKKGLAAALGRGRKKEKEEKEKEKEKEKEDSSLWIPRMGGSGAYGSGGGSSPGASTGASSPAAAGTTSGVRSPGAGGDATGSSGSATPVQPVRRPSGYGDAYPFNTSSTHPTAATPDTPQASVPSGPSLTIKYLLCPECDCGPLGYVVISEEMKGGGLARAVAASQGGRDEGGSGGGGEQGSKRTMEYLIAADRVRYRMKAN